MFRKVASELNVELNETIHRYRYASSFNDHDLKRSTCRLPAFLGCKAYTDVSKSRANGFETIPTDSLCNDCY